MKNFTSTIAAILLCFAFVQCDAVRSTSSTKPTAQGSPYEIVVVCNQPEWDSELGETIRNILSAYIPYLNQEESMYSVMRVTNQSYKDLIARHRNILEVNIDPGVATTTISVRNDVEAAPQVIMRLQSPSIAAASQFLAENSESLVLGFEIAERERDIAYNKRYSTALLDELIAEKFDVEMRIPKGYTLRQDSEDFLWLSFEHKFASQGIMIYSYPAEFGISSITSQMLLETRNEFASRVPGPSNGSYMTTFSEVDQLFRPIRINGRLWSEMRGFWDVVGDFMGGPYVSYSTIDERTNRVFTVDMYVYSPTLGKRNYLRSLEHIIYNCTVGQAQ